MRVLHTADWHLGRQFEGRSLEDDHAAVLAQVLDAIRSHRPDVLIIAGDVFDRPVPPETAVRQFNAFIQRVVSDTDTSIVVIAGNHDSGERIGAMATLADGRRALVRGPISPDEPPLVVSDADGPVAFSALPFAYELAARDCFAMPDIRSPEDVMRAQIGAARRHVPDGVRWVIVAHGFVSGGQPGSAERSLTRVVGGIETVDTTVFEGATYVALGHLHSPQTVGSERLRYSGSPLAFGFDEEGEIKSMTMVDIAADGAVTSELIPFRPVRRVRTLRGLLAELLAEGAASPSDDLIKVVLTDPHRQIDPMKRLRVHFPNTCTIGYEAESAGRSSARAASPASELADPQTLVSAFLGYTRDKPPTDRERAVVATALSGLVDRETAAQETTARETAA